MTSRRILLVVFICTALTMLAACQSSPPVDGDLDPVTAQGYATLYDLVSRQQGVSMILILKSVSAETKPLIKEIAATASAMSDQLEDWAKADGFSLKRSATALPEFSLATRDAVGSRATKYLLFGGGDTFEIKLIFTQLNACEYGLEMANLLASRVSADRRTVLTKFAKRYDNLFNRLVARLDTK